VNFYAPVTPECAPRAAASAADRTTFPSHPTRARHVYGLVGADWPATIAGCATGASRHEAGPSRRLGASINAQSHRSCRPSRGGLSRRGINTVAGPRTARASARSGRRREASEREREREREREKREGE